MLGLLWRERDHLPPRPIMTEEPWKDARLPRGGDLFYGLGLRPFGALGDLKLDLVAFTQGLEACRVGNRRVVDENIRTVVLRNKPEPFLVVKPLHRSMRHGVILLAWGLRACRPT